MRIKTPVKPKKALVKQKKVVRFVGSNIEEVVPVELVKQSSRGRAIKARVIFKEGTN